MNTPDRIRALVDAGMDVARMNLSHGSYAEHEQVYRMVRRASDEAGHGVGIVADLQGPKIRLGKVDGGPHLLAEGEEFTITTRSVPGDSAICSTTYAGLPGDVEKGDQILIDDGRVRVEVLEVDGTDVRTRVRVAGPVSSNKGLNLPGVAVSVPALSAKDVEDLRWALHLRADFIALSFVRSAAERTNDSAMKSALRCSAQRRSSTSLADNAGTDTATPGRFSPLLLLIGPATRTRVRTSVPSTSSTSTRTRPSSIRIWSPFSTSPGRPAYVVEQTVESPGTVRVVIVNSSPSASRCGPPSTFPSRIFGPCRSAMTPTPCPVSSEAWRTIR